MTRILFVVSISLTALALGGGLAHLYALPNKIHLSREEYFAAQQVYRGWALLGTVIAAALLSTIGLAARVYGAAGVFPMVLAAIICVALSLLVFFLFTSPANQATENWTQAPGNWEALRRQWEYSHAVGALLYFAALVSLSIAAVRWR